MDFLRQIVSELINMEIIMKLNQFKGKATDNQYINSIVNFQF